MRINISEHEAKNRLQAILLLLQKLDMYVKSTNDQDQEIITQIKQMIDIGQRQSTFDDSDHRTIKELAQDAFDVYTSSSMLVLAEEMSASLKRLKSIGIVKLDFINTHPISVLFANKMFDLSDAKNRFRDSIEWCDLERLK